MHTYTKLLLKRPYKLLASQSFQLLPCLQPGLRDAYHAVQAGAVAGSDCSVLVVIVQTGAMLLLRTLPKVLMSVALPCPAAGDVVGVLLNRVDHTISFTKNGMDLGVAFRDVREERLYPTVGMRTPDEEVLANFGSNSFRTNVEMLRAEAAEKVHSAIEHMQLPSKGRVRMGEAAVTCTAASWRC